MEAQQKCFACALSIRHFQSYKIRERVPTLASELISSTDVFLYTFEGFLLHVLTLFLLYKSTRKIPANLDSERSRGEPVHHP